MSIIQENKSKIYPWIKLSLETNEEDANSLDLEIEDQPIMQSWLGDLVICYCIDEGDQFSLIQNRDLDESEYILEDLHQIAIENLGNDVEFKLNETNFGGHGLVAGGNHEAAAICLSGIWQYLAGEFKDDLMVIIPAKDLIMFVPASQNSLVSAMEDFKTYILENGDRLLSPRTFKYRKKTDDWALV